MNPSSPPQTQTNGPPTNQPTPSSTNTGTATTATTTQTRPNPLKKLLSKLKASPATRIRRRRASYGKIWRNLSKIRFVLFVVGYVWMFVIPYSRLSRRTYSDENALQPAQVNTQYHWGDVHRADRYLEALEALVAANATSEERAKYISDEFAKLGLLSSTQAYKFSTSTGVSSGVNAYAVLNAPRISGVEAMLISASWLSLSTSNDGATNNLNLRGVATVLSIAAFLNRFSYWAKDIVLVVSDDYLDGMQAFVSTYHGDVQSNMQAQPLAHTSGVIWTAMHIDYPGHSFSHLGIFHESLNGRLPNADILNSFQLISRYTGGVPVVLYDHLDFREQRSLRREQYPLEWDWFRWVPGGVRESRGVMDFVYAARNVWRHWGYQSVGRTSGVHGLMRKYRIDAFTMFAVPSTGPHGFHAIGRTIESTFRTMNNLLERLHASFFFYILTAPDRFIKIGNYLPSAIIVSVAMMFTGLGLWVDAGWERVSSSASPSSSPLSSGTGAEKVGTAAVAVVVASLEPKWRTRPRPALVVLCIMAVTHLLGCVLLWVVTSGMFVRNVQIAIPIVSLVLYTLPVLLVTKLPLSPPSTPSSTPLTNTDTKSKHHVLNANANADAAYRAQVSTVLQAMNLCFASTVISITTVLNFSLAALLCVLLGLPLSLSPSRPSSSPSSSSPTSYPPPHNLGLSIKNYAHYTLYALLGWGFLPLLQLTTTGKRDFVGSAVLSAIRNWEMYGVWFVPVFCTVWVPLVVQAGLVRLLRP